MKIFLSILLIFFLSCTKKDQNNNEILIGGVFALSGNMAAFGGGTKKGIDLAIEQINAQGGVKGKKLRVLFLDDQGKPEEAATITTKLITQDKVVAILGEVASSISLAMAPIAQSYKIPMMSTISTNPKVTQVGDYIFRVCFIDPFQGSVMAKFAAQTLKVKKAAILKDIKSDYSVGLAEAFTKSFKELGGEIVKEQSYAEKDVDFKGQLTAIKASNPDVIFLPGYFTEVGLITRQAHELGIKAPFLGGDGWDSVKLFEIGGDSLNGNFFSNHYSQDDTSSQVQNFITSFKTKYQESPDVLAVMGYESAMVLADAMKKASSLSPEHIRNALAQTKNFPGVTGNITINAERNAEKPAVVLEIKNNKYNFRERVLPTI